MADISKLSNDAQLQAWTVFNLVSVLHAVIDEDLPGDLPVKSVLGHIMHLAQSLPDQIEAIELEARHG